MTKLPYLIGLGFVHEDSPAQEAARRADAAQTEGLARALDDDQVKALFRATTYGKRRYAQDVVRVAQLRELGLVNDVGLTDRGLKVARAIDAGVRKVSS